MIFIQLNDEKTQLEFISKNDYEKISCTNSEEVISSLFFYFVLGKISLTQVKLALNDLNDSFIKPDQESFLNEQLIESFRHLLGYLVDLDEYIIHEHLRVYSYSSDYYLIDNKEVIYGTGAFLESRINLKIPIIALGFNSTHFSIPIYSKKEGRELVKDLSERKRFYPASLNLLLSHVEHSGLIEGVELN